MRLPIYPKTHYVMKEETRASAVASIKTELAWWEAELEKQGRVVEAQRIHQRVMYDLEMIKAMGYCHGIENYSRHFTGRLPGEPPPDVYKRQIMNSSAVLLPRANQPSWFIPTRRARFTGSTGPFLNCGATPTSGPHSPPLSLIHI